MDSLFRMEFGVSESSGKVFQFWNDGERLTDDIREVFEQRKLFLALMWGCDNIRLTLIRANDSNCSLLELNNIS